jgi:ABC-type amino acid transport substrate-binding protein
MKRQYRQRIGIIVLATLVLWALVAWLWPAPPLLPSGLLRVGVDPSYPPFASIDSAGQLQGLEIALAQALADELAVHVHYVVLGYDGLYDALATDRADVLVSALVVNPAFSAAVRYTTPYYDAGLRLVSAGGYQRLHEPSPMNMGGVPTHCYGASRAKQHLWRAPTKRAITR